MTHNLDATVFVYRHRETGEIRALYVDDARAMNYRPDYEHVDTLEPRMWIEHHFDDEIKEREACAKACENVAEEYRGTTWGMRAEKICDNCSEAIRARGNHDQG